MADRLPPSRYSIVERGGRLVVIDRDTGQTPATAAERMAEHDRRMGHEAVRPVIREAAPREPSPAADVLPVSEARAQRPAKRPPNDRMAAAVADMNRKRPWNDGGKRPAAPQSARIAHRPAPAAGAATGQRKTIVTAKWWDSKGPRTIELGPKGQQVLGGGFVTLFFVALIAAIVMLVISPVMLFVAAFLLFRWGGSAMAPLGAGIVDKAVAERG